MKKRPARCQRASTLDTWSNLTMLAIESQRAICLRLAKIAIGGPGALTEMQRMAAEKMEALVHETARAAMGASQASTIRGYRRRVRANIHRLSK